ncbi:hypothetical protein CROQUDRAFT_627265 [Cronartium quercuum f. sp. fusiforme G11]|uniref:Uncharacterized protein n=1 Tax=Cronartium quercuum f. sp. fusiforme G11 TaxID=708437 RepID=A0A9P6NWM2_9BASI|nr:hypothetical protein CROQUDRAFT_627265 [Cronartium quercuum f. sp. fusiforme G11]
MFENYASDWTRCQFSESETRSEVCTELATTLSRNTPAKPHKVARLSFARHASVVESISPSQPFTERIPKPLKFCERNQHKPTFNFRQLSEETKQSKLDLPSNVKASIIVPNDCLDIQAILDGSAPKQLKLTNFRIFLQETRENQSSEESTPWLNWAPVMVEFLLEFKSYAEQFSRLPADQKTAAPHPFDIICVINSGLPKPPSYPSTAWARNCENESQFGDPRKNQHHSPSKGKPWDPFYKNLTPKQHKRPDKGSEEFSKHPFTRRKVNWAPSVRSKSGDIHDESGSSSISRSYPWKSRPTMSVSFSSLSSAVSSVLPEGLEPKSQPLRSLFDALIEKYLAEPIQSRPEGGLLSQCIELKTGPMKRAVLESKYTNHPAVLGPLVEQILDGLNHHVVPNFVQRSSRELKKNKGTVNIQTLIGTFILLGACVLEGLLIFTPSPLSWSSGRQKRLPSVYRLALFPVLFLGTILICSHRFKIRVSSLLAVNSGSTKHLRLRQRSDSKPKSSRSSLTHPEKNRGGILDPFPIHQRMAVETNETGWRKRNAFSWILTSLVISLIIQITFLFLPHIQLRKGKIEILIPTR